MANVINASPKKSGTNRLGDLSIDDILGARTNVTVRQDRFVSREFGEGEMDGPGLEIY